MTRRLPWPHREYDRVYIKMPDGSEIEMTPLEASLQLKEWADVVGGLSVYQAMATVKEISDPLK